jgi:ubiquinone biosynthesis protein
VAAAFAGDSAVRYPRVCWPLTTSSVLMMEALDGVKVSAVGTAAAPELDPAEVARRGANVVLQQILVHGLSTPIRTPGTS